MSVDLIKYQNFVESVTSGASNDVEQLISRLQELSQQPHLNISLLMTAAAGLASEGGEFHEIVKKIVYQGKDFEEASRYHMMRELGDIAWYWVNACRALDLDPNQVIAENVSKLQARYPGGKFDVYASENRKANDI